MKPPVLLIDLSALFRAAWHVLPSDGAPSIAFETTMSSVNRCVDMTRQRFKLESDERLRVAICCDGKGNWRKDIAPSYKAHRDKQPASMYGMLDRVKKRLDQDGFLLWEKDGFEADDVIGTAVDAIQGRDGVHDDYQTPIVIASHDKDMYQLLCNSVVVLNSQTWEFRDTAWLVAKWGIKSSNVIDFLSLTGDKSDGVPGCEGCGEKTATSIVCKYGTVEALYEYISDPVNTATDPHWRTGDGKKPLSILQKLIDAKESVLLAKKLIKLSYDVEIDISDLDKPREIKQRIETEDVGVDAFEGAENEMKELEERVFGDQINQSAPAAETAKGLGADPVLPGNGTVTMPPEVAAEPVQAPGKDAEPTQKQTALQTIPVVGDFERQLEPYDYRGVVNMAATMFNSGLYEKYKNPNAIAAAIIRGREMNYGALISLDLFQVVKNQLCPKAHFIIHLGESHPNVEYMYLDHSDDQYAEYVIRLKKWPPGVEKRHRYTIQEAVDAGLATLQKAPRDMTVDPKTKEIVKDTRGQWDKRRPEMLRKTAGEQTVRIYVPGAGLGLTSAESMNGGQDD